MIQFIPDDGLSGCNGATDFKSDGTGGEEYHRLFPSEPCSTSQKTYNYLKHFSCGSSQYYLQLLVLGDDINRGII